MENEQNPRIGEQRKMNNGLYATIIEYRRSYDIDIQFEDGTIVKNKAYKSFKIGDIGYPINHIGEQKIGEQRQMNNGMYATIIAYRNNTDIDIQFEDGTIVKGKQYWNFKVGNIGYPINHIGEQRQMNNGMYATIIKKTGQGISRNPLYTVQFEDGTKVYDKNYAQFKIGNIGYPTINRLGEKRQMNNGMYATIIEYRRSYDIDIQFEDGTIIKNKAYKSFKIGEIGHKYLKKNGFSIYQGFEVSYAYTNDDNTKVYYKTKCLCCGKRALLTPQDMITHRKQEPFMMQDINNEEKRIEGDENDYER